MKYHYLPQYDQEAFATLQGEAVRQEDELELIPSENYVSEAVLEALGSHFTNKYAEGTPGRRYYGGQTHTDAIERLTIERAKALFGADHASVQPLSGAAANLITYSAWADIGDTIMAMDLGHGGHLTHGAPVTFAAKAYHFIRYKIKNIQTGEIDYDAMRQTALQERPKIIVAGFSSYPRTPDYKKMAAIAAEVGAVAMADMAHVAGLIVGDQHPNPLKLGFQVMTTTTHKSLRGPRGALILSMGTVGNPLRAPEKTIENLPTLIDRALFPGLQGGPHMNKVLAIAVALKEAAGDDFKQYAKHTVENAAALAGALQARKCELITQGTENHLMVIDTVKSFGKNGLEAQQLLESAGITLNRNAIPDDPLPPFKTSGVRLGTPCVTTRGMGKKEMLQIAEWIVAVLEEKEAPAKVKTEVTALCRQFPVPGGGVHTV